MNMPLPRHILSRIYGDAVAVIINNKSKQMMLLEGELLSAWRSFLIPVVDGTKLDSENSTIKLFHEFIDNRPGKIIAEGSVQEQTIAPLDISVLHHWAFKNKIPISGHFELTTACNLRCRHCFYSDHHNTHRLSTAEICKIIDELYSCGTFALVLTGGEVFLWPDLFAILEYLQEREFIVRINTNGTLIDEEVTAQLAKFDNIFQIHVSLYSDIPEVHDGITGVTGSFNKTLHAIRLLTEAKVDVRINCSVMTSNFASYQGVAENIAVPYKIPVRFKPIIYPRDDGSSENQVEQISKEQYESFCKKSGEQPPASDLHGHIPNPKMLCKAGFCFFSISETCTVYPCLQMKRYDQSIGNLLQSSFDKLWNKSLQIKKIRKGVEKALLTCDVCDLLI